MGGELQFLSAALSRHTSVEGRLELCLLVLRWPGSVSPRRNYRRIGRANRADITSRAPTSFNIDQNETSWFVADRMDALSALDGRPGHAFRQRYGDGSTHAAPRAGFLLALTSDGKTLLKGGVGMFYDRVPLMIPIFEELPNRTVSLLDKNGQAYSSISYLNRLTGGLHNPQSTSWSVASKDRYWNRSRSASAMSSATLPRSSSSHLSPRELRHYRPLEFRTRFLPGDSGGGALKLSRFILNSSYVHSRAYGNLNDPSLFFGNYPQAVIQPDARARLPFDATNRFLFWGDIAGSLEADCLFLSMTCTRVSRIRSRTNSANMSGHGTADIIRDFRRSIFR